MTEKIVLGKQGFGAMGLTAFYGPAVSNKHGVDVMKAAYKAGCRMFDTAQVYQQYGEVVPNTYKYNEELVGEFVKEIGRENVTIATKFYPRDKPKYSWELLNKETDNSLKRLGIKCIDVYYLHRMYPESAVKIETIAEHMKKLVKAGKIKGYGLSEASPDQIRRAHAVHPVSAVQQEWSLFARDLEEEVYPTCKKLGIPLVAYSPIARGMLSGALTTTPKDWRSTVPYLTPEKFAANKKLVDAIQEIAKENKCSAAQICLAWVIAKGGIPIPGTTKLERATSNQGSTNIVLTAEEMDRLEKLGAGVQGLRGSEDYMKNTFQAQTKNDDEQKEDLTI